jgi:Zn-dependent protease
MRDLISWSFPIAQIAGITVRVHILMPVIMAGFILRETRKDAVENAWIDAAILMGLLFVVILLHEFGHCVVARLVGGDSREIVLWPLGGLASVEVPHAPAAHFLTAAGGPLVNVVLCSGAALALTFGFDNSFQPPWNPLTWIPFRNAENIVKLTTWAGNEIALSAAGFQPALLLARLFYVSWITLLLNMILVGFPLDMGRMFQASLWPWVGYRSSMLYAIFAGFGTMLILVCVGIWYYEPLLLLLAYYIFGSCKLELLVHTTGGEESLFGYDFSQGYTSLEKDAPPSSRKKRPNTFQRWLERRKQLKRQREQERQEADKLRLDQLLQKIGEHGMDSLTTEEARFMKRVAERYRNRR